MVGGPGSSPGMTRGSGIIYGGRILCPPKADGKNPLLMVERGGETKMEQGK